jgi:hypothetical protein
VGRRIYGSRNMTTKLQAKLHELMKPIDSQIMMCDDENDLLLFACALVTRASRILDERIGVDGRKQIMKDYYE